MKRITINYPDNMTEALALRLASNHIKYGALKESGTYRLFNLSRAGNSILTYTDTGNISISVEQTRKERAYKYKEDTNV